MTFESLRPISYLEMFKIREVDEVFIAIFGIVKIVVDNDFLTSPKDCSLFFKKIYCHLITLGKQIGNTQMK